MTVVQAKNQKMKDAGLDYKSAYQLRMESYVRKGSTPESFKEARALRMKQLSTDKKSRGTLAKMEGPLATVDESVLDPQPHILTGGTRATKHSKKPKRRASWSTWLSNMPAEQLAQLRRERAAKEGNAWQG